MNVGDGTRDVRLNANHGSQAVVGTVGAHDFSIITGNAIRATIELMEAPAEHIKIRSSYNLAGVSFTPAEIATEIKKHIPNFEMAYRPDFRQAIADSWPSTINDSHAQKDWGWNLEYDLEKMTQDMMINLKEQYKITV